MITEIKISKAVCTYNNGKWTIDLSEYEKEYWYNPFYTYSLMT